MSLAHSGAMVARRYRVDSTPRLPLKVRVVFFVPVTVAEGTPRRMEKRRAAEPTARLSLRLRKPSRVIDTRVTSGMMTIEGW